MLRVINSWVLCWVTSIMYLLIFIHESNDNKHNNNDLLFGFCVWSEHGIPNQSTGCNSDFLNSHTASFLVDCCMAWIVRLLYSRYKRRTSKRGVPSKCTSLYFSAMGTILLAHGVLHLFLFVSIDCYVSPSSLHPLLVIFGYCIFAGFSFGLCLVILIAGDSTTATRWDVLMRNSALFTLIVVFWVVGTGTEWLLPAMFAIAHPLSSYKGLRTGAPQFTQQVGWAFFMATLMGIFELSGCSSGYRSIGGHVLYDVWLGLAMILTLPPFAPAFTVGGKNGKSASL